MWVYSEIERNVIFSKSWIANAIQLMETHRGILETFSKTARKPFSVCLARDEWYRFINYSFRWKSVCNSSTYRQVPTLRKFWERFTRVLGSTNPSSINGTIIVSTVDAAVSWHVAFIYTNSDCVKVSFLIRITLQATHAFYCFLSTRFENLITSNGKSHIIVTFCRSV